MGCGHSQLRRDGQQRTSRRASQHVWDGVVKPAPEWKVEPALTTEQIERLRNEFWETRVEGRAEMWQALQAAAQADSDELRNEILKAAGLKPASKTGTLLTTYDERGALYEVPIYALRDPSNLNVAPTCPEFKDAARAVAEYCERRKTRGRR